MSFCGMIKVDADNNVVKWPYFIYDFRANYPDVTVDTQNISIEEINKIYAEYNIYPVHEESFTYDESKQKFTADETPVLIDGAWVRKVTVENLTKEEIEDREEMLKEMEITSDMENK